MRFAARPRPAATAVTPPDALSEVWIEWAAGSLYVKPSWLVVGVGGFLYQTATGISTQAITSALSVEETDGTPAVSGVSTIQFPPGTITDNGGGNVTVRTIYPIVMGIANNNITSGSTFYLGSYIATVNTVQGRYAIPAPFTGTIVGYSFSGNFSTVGTGESVTIDVWLNNATSVGSTTTTFDAASRHVVVTGLSQAVTSGQSLEFRIVNPTFATPPVCRFLRAEIFYK